MLPAEDGLRTRARAAGDNTRVTAAQAARTASDRLSIILAFDEIVAVAHADYRPHDERGETAADSPSRGKRCTALKGVSVLVRSGSRRLRSVEHLEARLRLLTRLS
jgi:hypothetical protein